MAQTQAGQKEGPYQKKLPEIILLAYVMGWAKI